MSEKLELESRLFHPVFAQYAPSIAELASDEWGHLFLTEQLVPTLRVHAAASRRRGTELVALDQILPLWRAMARMAARFGPLWTDSQLTSSLTHVAPLIEVWVGQEQQALEEALGRIRR